MYGNVRRGTMEELASRVNKGFWDLGQLFLRMDIDDHGCFSWLTGSISFSTGWLLMLISTFCSLLSHSSGFIQVFHSISEPSSQLYSDRYLSPLSLFFNSTSNSRRWIILCFWARQHDSLRRAQSWFSSKQLLPGHGEGRGRKKDG